MKFLAAVLSSLLLVACGGGDTQTVVATPIKSLNATFPRPVRSASTVSGSSEIAIHAYQALYGQAPSYAQLSGFSNQIGTSDGFIWAASMAEPFRAMSDTDFSTLVLNNISVTPTSLTSTAMFGTGRQAYDALQAALADYLNAVGVANRGTVVVQLAEIISNLEGDTTFGVYGVAATSFNDQVSANLAYSTNSTNTTPATVSTSPVTVVFDYTYDTNGFFTPERRVLIERAAATITSRIKGTKWARVDPVATGGHYELAFVNPSTLATSWSADVVIPENQITIYLGASNFKNAPFARMQDSEGDGASQLLSIRNVSGGMKSVLANANQYRPINSSITFDLQGVQGFGVGITRQWHFDSDGSLATDDRLQTDPHYGDYTDFYSTAIHELGHVFGIYYPAATSWMLESDPDFIIAYASRVQADGVGGYVFTGTYAKQFYFNRVGQNIPLEASTRSHMADGVRSQTADGWTSLTYESNAPFRHPFSELEFGVLKDIGYIISPN